MLSHRYIFTYKSHIIPKYSGWINTLLLWKIQLNLRNYISHCFFAHVFKSTLHPKNTHAIKIHFFGKLIHFDFDKIPQLVLHYRTNYMSQPMVFCRCRYSPHQTWDFAYGQKGTYTIDRHGILPMGKRVLIPHGSVVKYPGSWSQIGGKC